MLIHSAEVPPAAFESAKSVSRLEMLDHHDGDPQNAPREFDAASLPKSTAPSDAAAAKATKARVRERLYGGAAGLPNASRATASDADQAQTSGPPPQQQTATPGRFVPRLSAAQLHAADEAGEYFTAAHAVATATQPVGASSEKLAQPYDGHCGQRTARPCGGAYERERAMVISDGGGDARPLRSLASLLPDALTSPRPPARPPALPRARRAGRHTSISSTRTRPLARCPCLARSASARPLASCSRRSTRAPPAWCHRWIAARRE